MERKGQKAMPTAENRGQAISLPLEEPRNAKGRNNFTPMRSKTLRKEGIAGHCILTEEGSTEKGPKPIKEGWSGKKGSKLNKTSDWFKFTQFPVWVLAPNSQEGQRI